MSGDGRNRPTLLLQCMCFHVFFSCEHRDGLLLGLRLGHHKHQEEATLGGGPSGHQGVHRWGVSMSRSGESYVSVVRDSAGMTEASLNCLTSERFIRLTSSDDWRLPNHL